MSRAPVDAVLFDLDDTLVRYRRSPATLLAEAFAACDVEPLFTVEAYRDRFDEFADRTSSMTELRRECFAALCEARGGDAETGRRVADAFADARDHRNVELLPGAERVLRSFADRYRLGVVTNGARDAQAQKVAGSGVGDYVETVVYAGHETPPKPDPEPFARALDELGVAPERAVHVGDSRSSDVRGANGAGLRSVWIPASDVGDEGDDGTDDRDEADGSAAPDGTGPNADYRLDSLSALLPPPW